MKRILSILLLVVSLNGFAQIDVVRVGGIPCNKPYYYQYNDGRHNGYIPAVTKAIMKDVNLPYVFSNEERKPMYYYGGTVTIGNSLDKNDLYMTAMINYVNRQDIFYSTPYFTVEFYVLSNKEIVYRGLFDLMDKKIGVVSGGAAEARLKINQENLGQKVIYDELEVCDSLEQAIANLNVGKLDFVLISEQFVHQYNKLIKKFDLNCR